MGKFLTNLMQHLLLLQCCYDYPNNKFIYVQRRRLYCPWLYFKHHTSQAVDIGFKLIRHNWREDDVREFDSLLLGHIAQ